MGHPYRRFLALLVICIFRSALTAEVLPVAPGCILRQAPTAPNSTAPAGLILSDCILNLRKLTPEEQQRGDVRDWLPVTVAAALPPNQDVLLQDIVLRAPCRGVFAVSTFACSFRVSATWPPARLQAGPGFAFFPDFTSTTTSATTTARRLNITCPPGDWAAAVASASPQGLQPCGTATVSTGEALLAALEQLQPTHAQLLITLAANISLPASPTPQRAAWSPDDTNPLVVVYRNTTIAGIRSSSSSASPRVELDLRGRRNAFQLQQQQQQAANSSGNGEGPIVLNVADTVLVNLPPGPPRTWPFGLLITDFYHVGLDRDAFATPQMRHLRISLVLNPGCARYISYWHGRMLSLVEEEKESAAWMNAVLTPSVPYMDADGRQTAMGMTRLFLEKFNSTATAVPLLTTPMPMYIDVYAVEEPPTPITNIQFASNASELRAQLDRPWVGPQVIVALENITLELPVWPQEGVQLDHSLTLVGPSLGPRVTFDTSGHPIVTSIPPGTRVALRNMRVVTTWVAVANALPDAPAILPDAPGYSLWRARCMPEVFGNLMGQYEIRGCDVQIPPDFFALLLHFNSPTVQCTGGNRTVDCSSSGSAAATTPTVLPGLPTIPASLSQFMIRICQATGQGQITRVNDSSVFFPSHTLAGALFANSYVVTGRSDGVDSKTFDGGVGAARRAAVPGVDGSCTLQGLLVLLDKAAAGGPSPSAGAPKLVASSSSGSQDSSSKQAAAIGGGVAAGVLLIAVISACIAIFGWRAAARARSLQEAAGPDEEKGAGEAQAGSPADPDGKTAGVSWETAAACGGGSGGSASESGGSNCVATAAAAGDEGGSGSAASGYALVVATSGGAPSAAAGGRSMPALLPAARQAGMELPPRDGSVCSAFSKSYGAGVDGPTMLDVLLGTPAIGLHLAHPSAPTHLSPGSPSGGGAKVVNSSGGGGSNNARMDASNPVGSGSTARMNHQMLAGEIDGLIRRFEDIAPAAAVAPPSSAGGNKSRVLGSGGCGVVYKGEWRGLPVAIKVVLLQEGDSARRRERLVREVALSATLNHPNIVPTFHYTVQPVEAAVVTCTSSISPTTADLAAGATVAAAAAASASDEPPCDAYKLSIVMSYCNGGTLRDALQKGLLRKPWPPGPPSARSCASGASLAAFSVASQREGSCVVPASTKGAGHVPSYLSTDLDASRGGRLARSDSSTKGGSATDFRGGRGIASAASGSRLALVSADITSSGSHDPAADPRQLGAPPTLASATSADSKHESWADVRAAPNQALALFAALDVASGLEYLHACNVIHGDLSLQNILLASSDAVFPEMGGVAGHYLDHLLSASASASAGSGSGVPSRGTTARDAAQVVPQEVAAYSEVLDAMHRLPGEKIFKPQQSDYSGSMATGESVGRGVDGTECTAGLDGRTEATASSSATNTGTLWFVPSVGVPTPGPAGAADGSCGGSSGGGSLAAFARRAAMVLPLLKQVFKISDFGLSVRLEGDETHRSGLHQGTPFYAATEVLLSGKMSPAADIYSFGVCLWCLVHGVSLCQIRRLLPNMFTPVAPTLLSRMSPELHPGLRSLLRRCLAADASKRPTGNTLVSELSGLLQAALGPELSLLLVGAQRRECDTERG